MKTEFYFKKIFIQIIILVVFLIEIKGMKIDEFFNFLKFFLRKNSLIMVVIGNTRMIRNVFYFNLRGLFIILFNFDFIYVNFLKFPFL